MLKVKDSRFMVQGTGIKGWGQGLWAKVQH